jgi:hypothetical protein
LIPDREMNAGPSGRFRLGGYFIARYSLALASSGRGSAEPASSTPSNLPDTESPHGLVVVADENYRPIHRDPANFEIASALRK